VLKKYPKSEKIRGVKDAENEGKKIRTISPIWVLNLGSFWGSNLHRFWVRNIYEKDKKIKKNKKKLKKVEKL
jgi:hypothetical protein